MIVDVIRMTPVMNIRRVRRLPLPGNVLVAEGDHVNPEDIIAETSLPGEVLILDIAQGLDVSPDEADRCLVRELGDAVSQGDVIAESEGKIPRLCRAPVAGKLVESHQGKITLETRSKDVRILAGMIGVVEELIPEYGVVLATCGSLIQGWWGNGKVGTGVLKVLDKSLTKPLKASMVEALEPNQMLAAGLCLHADVVACAAEKALAGLILGVLAPELIPAVKELPMPVIVLQGFGNLPSDPGVFSLLKDRQDEITCVNACDGDIYLGHRPEVIIPCIQQDQDIEKDLGFRETLKVGQRVRVLSGNAVGQTGELIELPEGQTRFESGLTLSSAVIRLLNGETVQVPCQNLVITH